MTNEQQRLADYLAHMLEAIERIEHYVVDLDEMAFLNSKLVQDAVIRNFEIIGEASNNIEKRSPEFVKAHPELPLSSAYQRSPGIEFFTRQNRCQFIESVHRTKDIMLKDSTTKNFR
jgi:hypothetical protein